MNTLRVISSDFNQTIYGDCFDLNATGIIFGLNYINIGNEGVQQIGFGADSIAEVLAGYRPQNPNVDISLPYTPLAPPTPPAELFLAGTPNATTPAVYIQSTFITKVIERMTQDITKTVQNLEDLRETSGSDCPGLNLTDVKNLTESYKKINVDMFIYGYSWTAVPLLTVLSPGLMTQLTEAFNKTIDLINNIKDLVQCGVSEVKEKKNNSFKKLIDSRSNQSINETQYISEVQELMLSDSLKQNHYFNQNLFRAGHMNRIDAWAPVANSRINLIQLIDKAFLNYYNNILYIFNRPFYNDFYYKMTTIPPCLKAMFQLKPQKLDQVEMAINATYQKYSKAVRNLTESYTDLIIKGMKNNLKCQQLLVSVQEIASAFHVQASQCAKQALNMLVPSDLSANVTKSIARLFMNITNGVETCIDNSNITSGYGINYLAPGPRYNLGLCLMPSIENAKNMCADTNVLIERELADNSTEKAAVAFSEDCIYKKLEGLVVLTKFFHEDFQRCSSQSQCSIVA
ncbi:unnamed protein product [Diamesa hyperborea]